MFALSVKGVGSGYHELTVVPLNFQVVNVFDHQRSNDRSGLVGLSEILWP